MVEVTCPHCGYKMFMSRDREVCEGCKKVIEKNKEG